MPREPRWWVWKRVDGEWDWASCDIRTFERVLETFGPTPESVALTFGRTISEYHGPLTHGMFSALLRAIEE